MTLTEQAECPATAEAVAVLEEVVLRVPVGDLPKLAGELARLQALTTVRLVATVENPAPGPAEDDRLLDVDEAAPLLGTTPAGLYKRADDFPFTVCQGRRLMFSLRGIREYIRGAQTG